MLSREPTMMRGCCRRSSTYDRAITQTVYYEVGHEQIAAVCLSVALRNAAKIRIILAPSGFSLPLKHEPFSPIGRGGGVVHRKILDQNRLAACFPNIQYTIYQSHVSLSINIQNLRPFCFWPILAKISSRRVKTTVR